MYKSSESIANEAAKRNNFVLTVEVPYDCVFEAVAKLRSLDVVANISDLKA